MGPGPAKSIKIIMVVRTRYTTLKKLAKSQKQRKKLKRLLELDISPRHSKFPVIDDIVVASTMKDRLDQGLIQSLAPHRFEASYCKERYVSAHMCKISLLGSLFHS